jgi:hypothetical protein
MTDFLTDCSFKWYSMGPKFDQFIHRYAILFRSMRHSAGPWLRYAAQDWTGPTLCCIARDHGLALCHIARDLHTSSVQKKSSAMQRSRAMRHSA